MTTLKIQNLGQIKEANLSFGDLTVFVGPQATGKSIALQLLKLMVDAGQVQDEMGRYGLDWEHRLPDFLDVYFGEGMRAIWKEGSTSIEWEGKAVDLPQIAKRKRPNKEETVFFIPAQRVLALRDGWPRPFTDYTPGDPFAVREFSEKLRLLVEQEFGASGDLFPQDRRLKKEFRTLLQEHVFSDFHLKVDKVRSQKRLVLGPENTKEPLPYMVWSAGQREFVPLLLGFYWLMPRTQAPTRDNIKWVVLEELEMGLHPRAIAVVVLLVLELVARGYRVCLSTHSPQVLDALWALKHLRANGAEADSILDIFEAPHTQPMRKLAQDVMRKEIKVFYFSRETGATSDISGLDPAAEDEGNSGWGGLSEFSGRANRAVARSVANAQPELVK
jgi:putative AbiEii toxin of type IV toxin-antitoxin system